MTQEDLNFLKENEINFVGVADGYVKHIDHSLLGQYEIIYRKYLDANFVLTKWCGVCVYDMMKRLYNYYCENLNNKQSNEPVKNTSNRRRK